jgi:subfamily B ATP-binding cassette protein MsbA
MAHKLGTSQPVYRRLLGYARPHLGVFVFAIVAMALEALSQAGLAYLIKPMLDKGFVARDAATLKLLPLAILGVFLLRGLAAFGSSYSLTWIGRRVVKALRGDLFERYLYLPASFYDRNSAGHLLSKLTYNVEQVADACTRAITIIIRDGFTVLFMVGLMFSINWRLTLFMLLVVPLIAALVAFLGKVFRRYSGHIQTNVGEVTRVAEEAISGQRIVKIFNGQDAEQRSFDRVNELNRRLHMKLARAQSGSVPVSQMLMAVGMAGIVYVATLETLHVSVGEFGSFLSAVLLMMAPVKRLTTINVNLQRGISAGESIFAVLDEPVEPDDGERRIERARGEIEFRDLTFGYGDDKGPVLRGVNLCIDAGETVAFVGTSGSGKTTLVSLLARFYEPQYGAVLLDGIDVREYRLRDLRRQLSMVSQDVVLFNSSISANIAYAEGAELSTEALAAAVSNARLDEFVGSLPAGLDTQIGDRGVLLSGGQRQRIAIARALVKDAPVLILDEATSALDSHTETLIQDGLEILMRGRTTLVIAHRLSTIERADRIVVLEHGRIIEMGTHRELLVRSGRYAELHRLQFRDRSPV